MYLAFRLDRHGDYAPYAFKSVDYGKTWTRIVNGLRANEPVRVVREETYGSYDWRGSAGVRVAIGRYRVTYARDTGANEIGSAYRVGLEAGIK